MIEEIPAISSLEEGETYHRFELHETFGGHPRRRIAPSGDHPYVFVFTGEGHGYRDEFRDGAFVYTGEGRAGDMEMTQGNRAVRDHETDGRELHLFESNDEAWSVTYRGQFECVYWFYQQLPDTNGNRRNAIRFELERLE